ncbi:hypothetical protein niasHT_026378 [Heterodera trifolii]|uniref:Uncharacterized protein n=1 Tax=Heterodera trifolii TaxID=157864 RepID=A0ABD2KPS1_9BILA
MRFDFACAILAIFAVCMSYGMLTDPSTGDVKYYLERFLACKQQYKNSANGLYHDQKETQIELGNYKQMDDCVEPNGCERKQKIIADHQELIKRHKKTKSNQRMSKANRWLELLNAAGSSKPTSSTDQSSVAAGMNE